MGAAYVQIKLKVVGGHLYQQIADAMHYSDGALPRTVKGEPIKWTVGYKSLSDLKSDDLLSFSEVPSVLLLDVADTDLLDRVRVLERHMQTFVKNNPELPLAPAPLIVVLPSQDVLANVADFPDVVADWVYAPIALNDVARRVIQALKRRGIIKSRLRFGGITVIPETRSLTYEGRSTRLTPSEFMLLELFLGQMGTVIPFKDLVFFFRSAGKSAESNNIRVAIFQLRLKLEILSRSQVKLVSIHRQGYCLKQNTNVSYLTAASRPENGTSPTTYRHKA